MTTITIRGVRRGLTKRIEGARGGFSWVPDGNQVADITLNIDDERLARLIGPRAMVSKRHVSKLASGAIIATASNIKREP